MQLMLEVENVKIFKDYEKVRVCWRKKNKEKNKEKKRSIGRSKRKE